MAMATDMLPTRPANIISATVTLENAGSVAVMPRVRPTVPMAEMDSNRASSSAMPWRHSTMHPAIQTIKYMLTAEKALWISSSSSRRPNRSTSSRRRTRARALSTSTAKVFTLMPPPVEPDPAPINMRIMVSRVPLWLRERRSTVLKPAVRGVTAWNAAINSLSPADAPAKA